MRRSIDNGLERVAGDHVGIVDENGPYIHDHEKAEIHDSMERKDKDEQMVGN